MSYRYYFKLSKWRPTSLSLAQAFKRIQKDERDRIVRFVHKEDFKSALIGRLLMRKIVNQRFKIKNSEIKLARSDKNRPILREDENESIDDQIFNQASSSTNQFDFNISHQGDYCVAVGDNVPRIGVDIMKVEKRARDKSVSDYFDTMTKIFTEGEWKFIRSANDEHEQLKRFMRLWTLKESYVKADGAGLTINTRRLDFHCHTTELKLNQLVSDSVLFFDGKEEKDWTFLEYLLDDNYCVSIAINRQPSKSSEFHKLLVEIDFDQLIDSLDVLDDNIEMNNLWELFDSKKIKNF